MGEIERNSLNDESKTPNLHSISIQRSTQYTKWQIRAEFSQSKNNDVQNKAEVLQEPLV